MSDSENRMLAAKVFACEKYPYFSRGVHSMSLIETPGFTIGGKATLGCDKWWRVYYNPQITEEYPIKILAGMILHELGHLIRDHAGRADQFANVDHMLFNIAGDCAINPDQMAPNDNGTPPLCPLPDWAVMPSNYGMENNLAAETYYVQLQDKVQYIEGHDCGSASHGKTGDHELPAPSGHADDTGVTVGEAELIKRQIALEVIKAAESSNSRGNVPAGLRRWANDYMKSHVNYMAWTRSMLRNSYAIARGKGDYSFTVPSRRQQIYGRFVMPGMIQPRIRVGAIIDTSGSMSDKQLSQCMAEIRAFLSQIQGSADLYVASCDAAVSTIRKVQTAAEVQLVGGGGTDMCIAFEAFEKMRPQMDLKICLTDCYTPWPAVKPRGVTAIIQVGSGALPPWPCKFVRIPVEEMTNT